MGELLPVCKKLSLSRKTEAVLDPMGFNSARFAPVSLHIEKRKKRRAIAQFIPLVSVQTAHRLRFNCYQLQSTHIQQCSFLMPYGVYGTLRLCWNRSTKPKVGGSSPPIRVKGEDGVMASRHQGPV